MKKRSIRYNSNIVLREAVNRGQARDLTPKEFYVLMVTDTQGRTSASTPERFRDTRRFFDAPRGWLGLERTSSDRIYISKNFNKRFNPSRGQTFIATVADPRRCMVL